MVNGDDSRLAVFGAVDANAEYRLYSFIRYYFLTTRYYFQVLQFGI